MARTSRNNMGNSSFFHVMVQGINKEYIFNTEKNKKKYLEEIYKNNKDVEIIAYCIMNNHTHILVQTEKMQNIEDWMRKSNTSYALYYNKIKERVGYVFRDRYKLQPIKNEKHLYLCADYIHNNPVKAKICKNKKDYEFSSYSEIYNGNQIALHDRISQMITECWIKNGKVDDEKIEEFEFLEETNISKEKLCEVILEQFIQNRDSSLAEIKQEKLLLKELIKIMNNENKISYRIMEKYLEIGRETLRKINNY